MELLYASLLASFLLLVIYLSHQYFVSNKNHKSKGNANLPPGKTGFPVIGESFELISAGWKGHPEKFIFDRIAKYSSYVFRTSLAGSPEVVFCGPNGHKFLFSNENNLVDVWFPPSIHKLFPAGTETTSKEEGIKFKQMLPNFFKPAALQGYIGLMDNIAHRHFVIDWERRDKVVVFPLTKSYTLWLAFRLFLSVEDPNYFYLLKRPFQLLAAGIICIPINLPGTTFNRAIKSSNFIRKKLLVIIKQRKIDLAEGKAPPAQDVLSHMLLMTDDNGKFMHEEGIAAKILGVLIGGYDNVRSVCTSVVKYLAELPEVYQRVYQEQLEIAKSKAQGDLLNWDDIQRMKYSWNVACEVLRLAPPLPGTFREALMDFTYNGFSIPKGWKIYWSMHSTHKNPEFFPEPEKFDPSRFEGSRMAPYTYIPFGGRPRMCPGNGYALLVILVFIHHLVKRFRLEKLIPNDKLIYDPIPKPEKGLPIRLFPHEA